MDGSAPSLEQGQCHLKWYGHICRRPKTTPMKCNDWERRETSEDVNEVVRKYMIVKLREAWLKTWLSHGSRTQKTNHK